MESLEISAKTVEEAIQQALEQLGLSEDEVEIEVLKEIAHGLSNDGIAERLFISTATVRTHISNILSKLDVSSRTQAALWALRHGIATLENGQTRS